MKWSEVVQSCPTLCNPVDYSLPGSSIHGILQARILEWAALSLSRGSSWSRDRTQVSHIRGRRFNLWATREALTYLKVCIYLLSGEGSSKFISSPDFKTFIRYIEVDLSYLVTIVRKLLKDRKGKISVTWNLLDRLIRKYLAIDFRIKMEIREILR